MSKTIEISVKDKIAKTDFDEIVSFNSVYRLKFMLDEEWAEFPNRVAVVAWEGGAAEKLFTGDECDMPAIDSAHSEYVFLGVYSVSDSKRIASSFVRLRCRAGTFGAPQTKPVESLHEQILDLLNKGGGSAGGGGGKNDGTLTIGDKSYDGSRDVTVEADDLGLARVAVSGSYNDLTDKPAGGAGGAGGGVTSVNGKTGEVIISKHDLGLAEVALTGSFNDLTDAPDFKAIVTSVNGKKGDVIVSKNDLGLAEVAISGSFEDLVDAPDFNAIVTSVNGKKGDVIVSKNDLGLAKVAISGSFDDLVDAPDFNAIVTSVNGKKGDVIVSKNDLGLAQVALTGSYNDLTDKPSLESAGVRSINGKTGDIMFTKSDLGLGLLTNDPQMPIGTNLMDGVDLNSMKKMGFFHVRGLSNAPLLNAPMSRENVLDNDMRWCIMVLAQEEENLAVQVAFSERSDASVHIRTFSSGSWTSWEKIV